ncbi:MAG: tol-pal system protein YbgF [Burkholderiaceae bacterium]
MQKTLDLPIMKTLIACVLAVQLSSAWALFEDSDARKAILDLRAKLERLDIDFTNRLRSLEAKVDQIQQRAGGQLALQQDLERLRQEVAALRGQLEEQSNELSKTQQKQRTQFERVDSRIRLVEPVQVQIDGQTVSVERAEQRMYEAALNEFRQGNFDAAERALDAFLIQYPESPYAPEATFWLGSSQYALKKYKLAVQTQSRVVDSFPSSGRAPDALLNKGFAELELNRRTAAKRTFKEVQERYPDSSAARTAEARAD